MSCSALDGFYIVADDLKTITSHLGHCFSLWHLREMCENCLKEEFPNRERMCTDSGAYMANLKSCHHCQSNHLDVANKVVAEDGDLETVTFEHICSSCRHLVSVHTHRFWIDGDYQEYEMECALCGTAEDSISILPEDPRKMLDLF